MPHRSISLAFRIKLTLLIIPPLIYVQIFTKKSLDIALFKLREFKVSGHRFFFPYKTNILYIRITNSDNAFVTAIRAKTNKACMLVMFSRQKMSYKCIYCINDHCQFMLLFINFLKLSITNSNSELSSLYCLTRPSVICNGCFTLRKTCSKGTQHSSGLGGHMNE